MEAFARAWARHLLEEERAQLGEDRYSHDQGLIKSPMPVESLFLARTADT